ncbi:lysine decarboxylase [Xenorhabdus ishibashii]|nr:lysine decarboxylase [Xenorhabdus ishibashii]
MDSFDQLYFFNDLRKISNLNKSSFHVLPIQNIESLDKSKFKWHYHYLLNNFVKFEKTITQPFFDSLVCPTKQLKMSMEMAKNVFGTDATLYVTCGSSLSNQIAVSSLCNKKSKVLAQKGIHQSLHFYLPLITKDITYIEDVEICRERQVTKLDLNNFITTLKDAENVGKPYDTVIINSQTYEGLITKIDEVLKQIITSSKSIKNILIDEAWGAWTSFDEELKKHTAIYNARNFSRKYNVNILVTHSAHKSLFSLRQSSLLHAFGNEECIKRLYDTHFKLHTTSPSYPIISSTELSILHADKEGNSYSSNAAIYACELKNFVNKKLKLFSLYNDKKNDPTTIWDPTKVWIRINDNVFNGSNVRNILFDEYGIYLSRFSKTSILFNFHYGITEKCTKELMSALESIERKYLTSTFQISSDGKNKYNGFVIPYPPGIPLLIPGQEISESILDKINLAKINSTSLIFIKEEEL